MIPFTMHLPYLAVLGPLAALAVSALLGAPFVFGLLFQRIVRGDPEQVYGVFYNCQGSTITAGYAAVYDTATFDGVRVTKPATATLSLLVGIANKDIADSTYGAFQMYGYRQSVFITNDT
jgi:hypothetical protein